jgi:hypothetical protein
MGKNLTVSDGENVDNLGFELKRGGVITGRVTDSNGNPIAEESVSLMKLDAQGKPQGYTAPGGFYGFVTDDRGVYRIFGLPEGSYLVSVGFAQRENSVTMTMMRTFYARIFHPGVTDQSRAKVVEVSEGSETSGIDIVTEGVRKTYDVFGRVFDVESGQGVAGLEVGYGPVSKTTNNIGPWATGGQRTDSQGAFHIPSVLPGKYAVFARTDYESEFDCEPVMIEIADGDVNGVEIKLLRGATINGLAVVEGVNDPAVTAMLTQLQIRFNVKSAALNPPRGGNVKINPDGGFRVNGMKPGRVFVSIFGPAARGFTLLRVERDGASQGPVFDIAAGERSVNVRLVFGYGKSMVRGQIKGAEQLPTVGFMVFLQKPDGGGGIGRGGAVDARGQFLIEDVIPGEYELKLVATSRTAGAEVPPVIRAKAENFRQRISVGAGETPAIIVFDLGQREGSQ